MDMDNDNEFMRAGLEEEMLDVIENNVHLVTARVMITETILMDLDFARNTLAVHGWPDEDIVETIRFAVCIG
jgi:hypothetical protein